jgi:hypothetical protein
MWSKPAPLGYGNSIDSVAGVASPLLAGFSLASVIVVSDDARNFRWPGAAILALAVDAAGRRSAERRHDRQETLAADDSPSSRRSSVKPGKITRMSASRHT